MYQGRKSSGAAGSLAALIAVVKGASRSAAARLGPILVGFRNAACWNAATAASVLACFKDADVRAHLEPTLRAKRIHAGRIDTEHDRPFQRVATPISRSTSRKPGVVGDFYVQDMSIKSHSFNSMSYICGISHAF